MKVIVVDNNFSESKPQAPIFSGIADTALLLKNKPFFIPEFANPCIARPFLVVQISRLGRSISERFAHRYYNKVSIGIIFTAQNLWDEALKEGRPCDYARSFDGAAAVGKFVDIPESTQSFSFPARFSINSTIGYDSANMNFSIESLIAHISQYQLLRQGDLLFIGGQRESLEVHINEHLDGFLNDEHLLSFNIK